MKHIFILFLVMPCFVAEAQSIAGKWKTVDDETGEELSIVEIYERSGEFFGKVVRIFPGPGEDPDPICTECPQDDARYKKKVIGMEIIRDMKQYEGYWADGTVLDPKVGRIYRCRLWLEDGNLKIRGYWGPFYRTQTWKKAGV